MATYRLVDVLALFGESAIKGGLLKKRNIQRQRPMLAVSATYISCDLLTFPSALREIGELAGDSGPFRSLVSIT
jgi:hypothetical protein